VSRSAAGRVGNRLGRLRAKETDMLAMQTILHPTDYSPRSEYALRLAALLAKEPGSRLILLHVVEPPQAIGTVGRLAPPASEEVKERAWERLLQLWPADPARRVQHVLAEGDPAAQILRIACEHHCDLIVMGTHGRTGLDRFVLGSVAEQVVRRAGCPVLTIKDSGAVPSSERTAQIATDCRSLEGESSCTTRSLKK